jgi:thiol-disulfide isomerase/thioredoxin
VADERPPSGLASKSAGKGPSRYSIAVGLAFVAVIVIAVISATRSDRAGPLGSDPSEEGSALAEFALPEAVGGPSGDANVYQDDCASSTTPCPEEDVRTPACQVDVENVVRVCDLFDRPLVLSFWFTRFADCVPAQDELDNLYDRYRDRVNFLSVNVADDREKVSQIVADHGWDMPVGHDAQGDVAELYHVGVCPTVVLAYPGGILAKAVIGNEAVGAPLTAEIDALLRESRRRAAADD